MTNTVKVNLDKAGASLKIASAIAGVFISCFVVYNNLDSRMDTIERVQAVEQGVHKEWMRNMEAHVKRIYDEVIKWSPDGKEVTKKD